MSFSTIVIDGMAAMLPREGGRPKLRDLLTALPNLEHLQVPIQFLAPMLMLSLVDHDVVCDDETYLVAFHDFVNDYLPGAVQYFHRCADPATDAAAATVCFFLIQHSDLVRAVPKEEAPKAASKLN